MKEQNLLHREDSRWTPLSSSQTRRTGVTSTRHTGASLRDSGIHLRNLGLALSLFVAQIAVAQSLPTSDSQPVSTSMPVTTELVATVSTAMPEDDLTTLPTGKGLPVIIRVGLYFQDITTVDDNEGSFAGTVDLRLRWEDPRLRYPAEQSPRGFLEYRGDKAEAKMEQIWVPGLALANLAEDPSYQATSVRIFPNGKVEIMQRTTGQFQIPLDSTAFPFDRQSLAVDVSLRRETSGEASLVFLQEDLEFSRFGKDIKIDGWTPQLVQIKRDTQPGWYGETHSGLVVKLEIQRDAGKTVAPIFIPLIATLLIPLLAIWMNSAEDGDFAVDAFELANVIVGGLFAVIALNFTVNSEYKAVSSGDNTVTRLFGLNYVALGIGLGIVVFLYRYNIPKKLFGRYVQEQLFNFLVWSIPLIAFGAAAAFIFVAAA